MGPQKQSTGQDYHERIVRTLVFLQEHLDEELSLGRMAGVAAFSTFHFHRIFRALVGEAPAEHIRRLRLERAAQHLKRLETPVTELALAAGYDSHEAFTRAFRAMFGLPPSEYRAAHRPLPETASRTHYGETMTYQAPEYGEPPAVEVTEVPPTRIVFLRHVGPYNEVGKTWGRLMMWAGMRSLLGPGMRMLGVVHDDPDVTPPEKLRYDAAVAVSRPIEPQGEFGVMELAGGRYAVTTHRGPYESLSQTYQRLYGTWLPRNCHEVRDVPAFEEYLNSPQNTKPEDLLTKIWVPIV
jgi:AraC family transcriptional regulator